MVEKEGQKFDGSETHEIFAETSSLDELLDLVKDFLVLHKLLISEQQELDEQKLIQRNEKIRTQLLACLISLEKGYVDYRDTVIVGVDIAQIPEQLAVDGLVVDMSLRHLLTSLDPDRFDLDDMFEGIDPTLIEDEVKSRATEIAAEFQIITGHTFDHIVANPNQERDRQFVRALFISRSPVVGHLRSTIGLLAESDDELTDMWTQHLKEETYKAA